MTLLATKYIAFALVGPGVKARSDFVLETLLETFPAIVVFCVNGLAVKVAHYSCTLPSSAKLLNLGHLNLCLPPAIC